MSIKDFNELYIQELRDLYSAESQLVAALPAMARAADSPQLSDAIEMHLEQTKEHVARLDQIFADLKEKPTGHKCKAMEGLIEEGKEMVKEIEKGPIRDAAIITAAQRIEHYEISGYGSARTFAEQIGEKKHAQLLQTTLDEEAKTDENLTKLAVSTINEEAAASA
jgi:ferritin-like metal-binding protein YciE